MYRRQAQLLHLAGDMQRIGSWAVLILVVCLSLTGCATYFISKSQTSPSQTTPPTLSSISITAPTSTVDAGSSVQLTAVGTFSDKSTATLATHVTWKSSDSSIAFVDASGLLTALRAGAVTVTATDGGISGAFGINVTAGQVTPTAVSVTITAAYGGGTPKTATLNVSNATIQSIAVTPSATTITSGTTQTFEAVGTFNDGSLQDITSVSQWTSSAPEVAIVDQSGVATGASRGRTNVTAMFKGVSNTAVLTVQ